MSNDIRTNLSLCNRRGFFRCAGVVAVIAALAGGISAQAYAHGGPGFRGGIFSEPMDAAQLDERMERMLKHLYVEINATDEQKKKLDPIVKQAIKDLQLIREQMGEARGQAARLFSAERIDRAAIEKMRAERMKSAEAISRRMSRALADIAEVLTPAQRKEITKRIQHHGRGMWHRG